MKTHKDLQVWNDSIALVVKIYEILNTFPTDEKYGIISQIKRCAVSIPSNIAEGAARTSKKEFSHFLSISLGSIAELETQLIISNKLDFLSTEELDCIMDDVIKIRKMILGLKKAIKGSAND